MRGGWGWGVVGGEENPERGKGDKGKQNVSRVFPDSIKKRRGGWVK